MTAPAHTLPSIDDALEDLAGEFDILGDWEERYRYVIDLGRDLAPLAEAERSDVAKVRGCASQVWLVAGRSADGRLTFRGDSDAHIVRGLIAILLRFFSGRTASEILAFDAKAALARLGLSRALSTQRANGLAAMVERIRRDAGAASGDGPLRRPRAAPTAGGPEHGVVAEHHIDVPAIGRQR